MKIENRAFTLTELIVATAIVLVLTVSAYVGFQKVQEMMKNNRMMGDLLAIKNALNQYYRDHDKKYPLPDFSEPLSMNMLCFTTDALFSECESAAFYQGKIDEKLLSKRYLTEIPRDPWTGANYAYGVSEDGQYFMVAGIEQTGGGLYRAFAVGNLEMGYHFHSLIRAYNGPNFVTHQGASLPYGSDPGRVSALLVGATGVIEVRDKNNFVKNQEDTLYPGDTITTGPGESAHIYFSDGSVVYIGEDTKLTISLDSLAEVDSAGNAVTRVYLKLIKGTLWNKVARLAERSEFLVETTSAIAGVQGTEFGACADNALICPGGELVIVKSGKVKVSKIGEGEGDEGSEIVLEPHSGVPVMIDVAAPVLDHSNVTAPGESQMNFIGANLASVLHPGIIPSITMFTASARHTKPTVIAKVGMNGFTSRDYGISGFEVYKRSYYDENSERLMNMAKTVTPSDEGAFIVRNAVPMKPVSEMDVGDFFYDPEKRAYFAALERPISEDGNRLVMEGVIIRAFIEGSDGTRIYSGLSQVSLGFNILDSDIDTEPYIMDFAPAEFYSHMTRNDECKLYMKAPLHGSRNVSVTPELKWGLDGDCGTISKYELELIGGSKLDIETPNDFYMFRATQPLAYSTDYSLKLSAIGEPSTVGGSNTEKVIAEKEISFTTRGEPVNLVLQSITLKPYIPSPWISDGSSYALIATGKYLNNTEDNLTADCAWEYNGIEGSMSGYFFTPKPNVAGTLKIKCVVGTIYNNWLNVNIQKPAALLKGITVDVTPAQIISDGNQGFTLTATGTYTDNTTKNITGECAWSRMPYDGVTGGTWTYGDSASFIPDQQSYGNPTFICTVSPPGISGASTQVTVTQPVYYTLQDKCTSSNGGYWQEKGDNELKGSCWIMGDAGASCDTACTKFGNAHNLTTVSCNPDTSWNDCGIDDDKKCGIDKPKVGSEGDDGAICLGLMSGEPGTWVEITYTTKNYAPYWADDGEVQKCSLRNPSASVACSTPPNPPVFRRLCSCTE